MSAPRDPERLARVDALLDEALQLHAEARGAWLTERCTGDSTLRREVEELLGFAAGEVPALDSAGGVGEALLKEVGDALAGDDDRLAGHRIGPWRLLREIGHGGMGTVYLAERADGEFEQRVALKVLRTSIETATAVLRFEQERQILATLEHPNIARLLDGGRTQDERPYLAMEFVDGQPIDRYCDEHQLGLEARLRLFTQIGDAVQYAHQQLIVHRDLKPANIVVTAAGSVKLLDFGIAKPLAVDEAELTRTMARVLTPEYGSPEQFLGRPVSAASDVYQLGLLLYELLTGQRGHQFDDTTATAIEYGICERLPERPSLAARKPTASGAPRAAAQFARALRGDLDTIVLKALRKEPERRYPSVTSLLDDLERYLTGRPIRARPDTLGYRTGKFVGRHRLGLAASISGALLLATLTLFYTTRLRAESERVRAEADKSQAALEFVLATFSPLDPVLSTSQTDITARELLERSVAAARRELTDQPEVQAALLDAFGSTYRNLGLFAESEDAIEEALTIRRRLPAPAKDIAMSLTNLSNSQRGGTNLESAADNARAAIALLRREAEANVELAGALAALASTLGAGGRFDEALPYHEEAVRLLEAEGEFGRFQLMGALHDYGTLRFDLGDYEGAAELYGRVVAIARSYPDDVGTPLPWALGGRGAAFTALGRLEEGEVLLREALELMDQRFDGDHPEFSDYERSLATNLAGQERFEEAEVHHLGALERYYRTVGPRHHEVAKSLYDLSSVLRRQGRYDEAQEAIADCLDILGDFLPPTHPHVGRATAGAAWIELEGGSPETALVRFDAALGILESALPASHSLVLETRIGRASAKNSSGQAEQACTEWREVSALAAAAQLADTTRDDLASRLAACG